MKNILRKITKEKIYIRPLIVDADNFEGKVVLVTGGSSGIGFEIAKKFAKNGAKVIITGRDREKLEKASKNKNIDYIVNDVSDIASQKSLIDAVKERFGKVDVLVNNAGVSMHESDFMDVTEGNFDVQFGTNLKGPYFLTQKIIKEFRKDMSIIFISSERGDQCDFLPYGLTKTAVNSFVRALSCKYYKNNIRVNGIAPGVTATNMFRVDKNGDMQTEAYSSNRFFRPEEVAEVAYFIASNQSNCISGEIIHCNAGNHINRWF